MRELDMYEETVEEFPVSESEMEGEYRRENQLLRRARSSFRSNKGAWLGLTLMGLVVFTAVFAPVLAPYDPYEQVLTRSLRPPVWSGGSLEHILGTDHLGRDVLSRVIYGSRISLGVGLGACLLAGTLGTLLGLISGYFGGRVDDVVMRIADVQLAFPFILLATVVMFVLGSGLRNVIIVLGVTGWVRYGRVVRGEVLAMRRKDFVEAATAVGCSNTRTISRHVFPNVVSSVIVMATLEVARVIIAEASLTFLGLGVDPRIPTWGSMLADGRQYLAGHPWIATYAGLAIMLTVLGINLLGDWLRDTFDPRMAP
ncbi:MAG: ABC transporter permease [Bacillota bacterium]